MDQLDLMEVLRRAAKYLIEGGAVALAACLIPKNKLNMGEVCARCYCCRSFCHS